MIRGEYIYNKKGEKYKMLRNIRICIHHFWVMSKGGENWEFLGFVDCKHVLITPFILLAIFYRIILWGKVFNVVIFNPPQYKWVVIIKKWEIVNVRFLWNLYYVLRITNALAVHYTLIILVQDLCWSCDIIIDDEDIIEAIKLSKALES